VITLLLVDDDAQVRAGLKMRMLLEEDLDVVAETHDANNAVELARIFHPDVVVMDVSLPGCPIDGIDAIHQLAHLDPCPRTVVLTMFDSPAVRRRAAECGAALVGKHQPVDVLLAAIRAAADETSRPAE
jgi:DNA-binding NarL/FixJ family response regulator